MTENKKIPPSELRRDLISDNWVIIAKGRGKKPRGFKKEGGRKKSKMKPKDCPFCNIETQEEPLLIYNEKGKVPLEKGIPDDWTTVVIPNKFPALRPSDTLNKKEEGGVYETIDAVGHCELIIPRDHKRNIPNFTVDEIEVLIDACKERYLALMDKPFVNYVSIFQNFGDEAGASQPHPHIQIITTPLIDVDLIGSLKNAEEYYEENEQCLYCRLIEWEQKVKTRIVYENKHFIALCPFASKTAFQVIISPKKHLSNFEKITEEEKRFLAEAAQKVARAINRGLGDPPYNFYLHTVPCDGKEHPHYHWHWTILPRTNDLAGFELGTHMEISTIEPEKAAEYLKKQI